MSNWISVYERLPEEYVETVLVARSSGAGVPCVMAAFYTGDGFVSVSIAGNRLFKDATHWMPLPEPPEVEE